MVLNVEAWCCHIDFKYHTTKVRKGCNYGTIYRIIPEDFTEYVLGEEN